MNYELLTKLKEVGFPQKGEGYFVFPDAGHHRFPYGHPTTLNILKLGKENGETTEEIVYEPTTDELIEELGDDFQKLDKYGEKVFNNVTFDACGGWDEDGNYKCFSKGTSAKEALIKLYIALNSVDN